MSRFWQVTAAILATISLLSAEESGKPFVWDPPKSEVRLFTAKLGMLDSERDEYATNLAIQASNGVVTANASPSSLDDARQLLGLALQLSPRNKRAVVVNFQLSKGVLPELTPTNYAPPALARLLLSRGQVLEKQGAAENSGLARYFIQLAAQVDPKNDDAVYASEVLRLDLGPVDWSAITDAEAKSP